MTPLRRTTSKAIVLGTALLSSACYNIRPVTGEPRPNAEVIVDLTEAGGTRLGGVLGPSVVMARGRPVRWAADSVTLAVLATTTALGSEQFWQGESVVIPRDAISRVRERRIDRGKTALLGAAALGLGILGANAVRGEEKGIGKPPPTGPGL